MGIDRESNPNFVWIQIDDKPEYLKILRKSAVEELDTINKEKKLLITSDIHTFEPDEYYFDESENAIHVSGTLKSANGDCYISLDMPLSDTVFIDIIEHAVKRLNKLKTAMESLK